MVIKGLDIFQVYDIDNKHQHYQEKKRLSLFDFSYMDLMSGMTTVSYGIR